MALTLGTNCGFVEAAPAADPEGISIASDTYACDMKDTSPAGAALITEIGWYCDNATEEANFEVGLYAADGADGVAGTRLYVDATNAKGTDAGWKSVAVSWSISAETAYWLAFQLDDTATATNCNYLNTGGAGWDRVADTGLSDPFGGGAASSGTGLYAIYAVWTAGGATASPTAVLEGPLTGPLGGPV